MWSGVLDWLDSRDGKVSKQDVLDYLAENNVRIEEVMRSGESGEWAVWDEQEQEENYFETEHAARVYGEEIGADNEDIFFKDYNGRNNTKYSQYQVPGGENYREMLLTLPEFTKLKDEYYFDQFSNGQWGIFNAGGWHSVATDTITAEHKQILSDLNDSGHKRQKREGAYRSSHWDEPNVLAHIRFDERTVDGKKVLFIQEIQSDWMSDIRKKGVKPDVEKAQLKYNKLRNALKDKYGGSDRFLEHPDFSDKDRADLLQAGRELDEIQQAQGEVPNAPWQKTYYLQAMKRMVRYAAENGYDSVSWTPGSVHAQRWGSEKIAWKKQ